MKKSYGMIAAAAAVAATTLLSACGASTAGSNAANSGSTKIGVDQPRSDSDFWKAFGDYVPKMATSVGGVSLIQTASNNDTAALSSNMQTLVAKGAKALVIAPQDTAAITAAVKTANTKKIPVVSVDTIPDAGDVYMVVRADNEAYGTKSCEYLGATMGGKGTVAVLQGDLASINGRDRSSAFDACMKDKFPAMKVVDLPTKWDPATGAAMLKTALIQNPDLGGIYMQASIYLSSTVSVLKQSNKLIPAGQPGHINMISNDGVKAEFDSIAKGELGATISQPADLYSKYGIYYAKAAADGKTFKVGPTDHGSKIIQVRPGTLEDLLPAPVVTKDGATFGDLTTLKSTDPSLWGNAAN